MMEFTLEKLKTYIVESAILLFTDFSTEIPKIADSKNLLSWKEYLDKIVYGVSEF